ncbi:BglG family transcription antiterminator [Alteribacillus sp. YIM 98480]|uniref:BglG family transcription antiterminator n=1 Tax=Alteribacillus sp. YIM 98480 TaxID=2606599 RepID=UPI00131E4C73|nr:BglG family transcription antiterminator [Alteribacillus sp. YIM 98480]
MEQMMKNTMQQLLSSSTLFMSDLEDQLNSSKGQIEKIIQLINEELKQHNFHLLAIQPEEQIVIPTNTRKGLCEILRDATYFSIDDLTPELRVQLMLITLLVEKESLSLQDLAERTEVSKNTVLLDMKLMKRKLEDKSIEVKYSRKHGYFISGSEYQLRNLLVTELKQLFQFEFANTLLKKKQLIEPNEVFLLRQRLLRAEQRLEISFSDEQIEVLPVTLHLLIKRIQAFQQEWVPETEDYGVFHTDEYEAFQQMFWDQNGLTEKDRLYLTLQVLSSNMLEAAIHLSHSEALKTAIDRFIDQIELNLVTSLVRKEELKEKLWLHIKPAVYRVKLGLHVQNPLTQIFQDEHASICSIVNGAAGALEDYIGKSLPEEEKVYIAMLVQAWIYQTNEQGEKIFKAMVVCRNGTSVSKLLLETLKLMFPHIEFLGAFSERTFNQKETVDFIFTTIPLHTSQKTFIVNPILDQKERAHLRKNVRKYIERDNEKKARELLHSLRDHIEMEKQDVIHEKIVDFFDKSYSDNKNNQKTEEKEHQPFFTFEEQHIHIIEERVTWKEAVCYSLHQMKERQAIESRYMDRVLELFLKESDRMMLGPHVYLPHAKPSDGVRKEDFDILLFRSPVEMPDGGMAKALVTLSPIDFQHHVPTLLSLNELFMDETKSQRFYQANHALEIVETLQQHVEEEHHAI